jgi:hypothetical protein
MVPAAAKGVCRKLQPMGKFEDLERRLEEAEKRLKDLEAKPLQVIGIPYVVPQYVPQPIYVNPYLFPYIQPPPVVYPVMPPTVWISNGTCGAGQPNTTNFTVTSTA